MSDVTLAGNLQMKCSGGVDRSHGATRALNTNKKKIDLAAVDDFRGMVKELVKKAELREGLLADWASNLCVPGGLLTEPYIDPGSAAYDGILWDWDSWWTNVALRQVAAELGDASVADRLRAHERGCVLNFLRLCDDTGWIPLNVKSTISDLSEIRPQPPFDYNMHKPCLAQQAAFLVRADDEDEWLRPVFGDLQRFLEAWLKHYRHGETGLLAWKAGCGVGVDNDPCSYFRPSGVCGSIYLNAVAVVEFRAAAWLARRFGDTAKADYWQNEAEALAEAVRQHCWDPWLGFYYSADLNLLPRDYFRKEADPIYREMHAGEPRTWDSLPMRIGVWSGFLALWAGIATDEQAERMVAEHFWNTATFRSHYGVRSLSKAEPFYRITASGNPSCWLGPVWGISNYMIFRGLVRYGYEDDARWLAETTVDLFARDWSAHGCLHEYYHPDSGEPVINPGFRNWNLLVLNMLAWLEGRPAVAEFTAI